MDKGMQSPALPRAAGVIQFDVRLGDWSGNLQTVVRLTENLAPERGALIVLPELWATGFDYGQIKKAAAQTPQLLAELQRLAAKYAALFAGSLVEAAQENGEDRFYNTLFVTSSSGTCGKYRKQQLFAPMAEDQHFTAGDKPLPIRTPFGLVAGSVCYDLRFPGLAAGQAAEGAKIIAVSAQWPTSRREHWRTLLRARAIENQAYVVACNRCGTTGQTEFGGFSAIIGPEGEVLFEAENSEISAAVALNQAKVEALRLGFNTVGPSPYRFADRDKFTSLATATQRISSLKSVGKTIVFTNGCFDILHKGHVVYLEQARKQGDFLVLGLNSDCSIQSIKGPDRPINREESRARVLAALGCVDLIVLFGEETPLELINEIMPDVLVKGADWPVEKIVGGKEVIANGGRVINIPMVENFSTTSLIAAIQKS
jgi:rfaE bifunctional protein nucleotidyltransferase chain/domain